MSVAYVSGSQNGLTYDVCGIQIPSDSSSNIYRDGLRERQLLPQGPADNSSSAYTELPRGHSRSRTTRISKAAATTPPNYTS
ncbi:hypothetical protein RRG08_065023 [Elysia crispata]|uniref:Uncharacterized protein n=1 Tax=Elysia crispata TaxID=231223 RepID=A0AAE1D322_9GAST|nr:hypothetical protein RRG08_065023 [Elysia crispata]